MWSGSPLMDNRTYRKAFSAYKKARNHLEYSKRTLDRSKDLLDHKVIAAKDLEAAEQDSGHSIDVLRIDGGMSRNPTFVQALADATQRPVEISPVREATGLGAALLAGIPVGHHASVDELATTWKPRETVEPARVLDRDRWRDAVARSRRWIPELSGIDF